MIRFVYGFGLATILVSSVAAADSDTDYCDKVKSRANADSAILFAPTLTAQGIKFPSTNPIEATVTGSTSNGYQIRALTTWSPLDFYKGFGTLDVAKADCQQHQAMMNAINVIAQVADVGKLPALRKQVEYLTNAQPVWQNIVLLTDQRLRANVITLTDAMSVREKALLLDRKLVEMSGQMNILAAKSYPETSKDLSSMAKLVEESSTKFERETNHVRSLDPWTFTVSAGLIPPQGGSDVQWFGVASVGFNFGAFTHNANDSDYLTARTKELKNARYELRDQLSKFKDQIKATIESTSLEVSILKAEEARLVALRSSLQGTEAAATPALLNSIDLDNMDLESDRVFLEEFKNQLSQWK